MELKFSEVGAVPLASSVVKIDPWILGGTPCFARTRVPIKTLFDYVEGGDTLDFFLEQFRSVSRAQAVQLLKDSQRAHSLPHEGAAR